MKKTCAIAVSLVCLAVAAGFVGFGQAGGRAKPQAAAGGSLAPVAFLAGTWRGVMNENEFVEEIWSEPSPRSEAGGGDTMMGVFRWLNAEGRPRMYEVLTLSHEESEIILRLRHYTSKMDAWEEKDAPVTLRLAERSEGKAAFVNASEEDRLSRVVFAREGNALAIDVEFREGMGETLRFRFERDSR